jgi:hypothetical protein
MPPTTAKDPACQVECPNCGAKAGTKCTNYLGKGKQICKERVDHFAGVPMPPVSKPAGSLALTDVHGFPDGIYGALSAAGCLTLFDLEKRVAKQSKSLGEESRVFAAFRSIPGIDAPAAIAACDAVMRHLKPATAPAPKPEPEPEPKKPKREPARVEMPHCRICRCTEANCSKCIERTGKPCSWATAKKDLCSACQPLVEADISVLFIGRNALPDQGTITKLTRGKFRTVGQILTADADALASAVGEDTAGDISVAAREWVKDQLAAMPDTPKPAPEPKADDFTEGTPPPKTRPQGTPVKAYLTLPPGAVEGEFAEWDKAGRIPAGCVLAQFVGTAETVTGYKVRGVGVKPEKIGDYKPAVTIREERTGKTFVVLAPIGGA